MPLKLVIRRANVLGELLVQLHHMAVCIDNAVLRWHCRSPCEPRQTIRSLCTTIGVGAAHPFRGRSESDSGAMPAVPSSSGTPGHKATQGSTMRPGCDPNG